MKLSAFVCIINPEYWEFPYLEAIRSYCDLCDEVIVIDSGSTDGSLQKIVKISDKIKTVYSKWPWEFKQREYPIHYNQGFDLCTGDWKLKMDIDFIIDDRDIAGIRKRLEDNMDKAMATFQRHNVFNKSQYYDKGKMPTALNSKFPNIKVGVPDNETKTDWTIPVVAREYINGVPYGARVPKEQILDMGIPIWNYDCTFRTKDKCKTWFQRIARGYARDGVTPLYGDGDDKAWEAWIRNRTKRKENTPMKDMKIDHHPSYIRDKIGSMTPDLWGFDNWKWELD